MTPSSIRYLRSDTYTFSSNDRRVIHTTATATVREVRQLLPSLPTPIELTVRPGADVIREIGQGGDAMPPNGVMWTVDPNRPGGVAAIAKSWLRACLYHELHHLTRAAVRHPSSIVEHAVSEGMATAFERDFAGSAAPWGQYPDNVPEWALALASLPANSSRGHWLFSHPDGRRWIGYKVGTYRVDRAMSKTGHTSATLVTTPAAAVISMASDK